MTENLLQKLEEKMMMLLSEVEELRVEVKHLNHENSVLRMEREKYLVDKSNHERKLQDLISLFDAVKIVEATVMNADVAA
jgi:regulator of replication initiation timing